MSNLRSPSRPERRAARFVPQLEALEDRNCPSFIGVHGHTLLIIGDPTADMVSVTDSGNGTVTGTIDGQSATGTTINHVVVHTRGGDDTLTYTLTNPLTSPLHLQIDMGAGNDTATLDFSPGVSSSRLKIDFNGGKGDDTLTTMFGDITSSRVNFRADLGKGADTFDSTLLGNVIGDSAVRFLVNGSTGDDTIGVHAANTNIDANARVDLDLLGGKGNDTINVDYQGVLNGKLRLNANGGPGDDTINANLTLNAGSTGELRGRVRGGPGNDTLTFNVVDNSGGTADVDASVSGGPGADTIISTPNVKQVG